MTPQSCIATINRDHIILKTTWFGWGSCQRGGEGVGGGGVEGHRCEVLRGGRWRGRLRRNVKEEVVEQSPTRRELREQSR
jgi:hypothetical protein